jgi:hypothetical protein
MQARIQSHVHMLDIPSSRCKRWRSISLRHGWEASGFVHDVRGRRSRDALIGIFVAAFLPSSRFVISHISPASLERPFRACSRVREGRGRNLLGFAEIALYYRRFLHSKCQLGQPTVLGLLCVCVSVVDQQWSIRRVEDVQGGTRVL